MTRVVVEVSKELKKTTEYMLWSSRADNVTVSIVAQILENLAGAMNKDERVAQNVFGSVNNLLEIDKKIIEESERGNNSATR